MFRRKKTIVNGLAIFSVGLVIFLSSQTYFSLPLTTSLKSVLISYVPKSSVELSTFSVVSSSINVINFSKVADETLLTEKQPFDCPVVEVFEVKFPICLFQIEKDEYVSKAAQSGNTYWEKDIIGRLINLLRRLRNLSERYERDIVFFDLGTNIGTYSLPVLQSGFKVISSY